MDKQFVVVKFIDEQSVGVVHCSWVEHDKQAVYCYWPSTGGNFAKRVQKAEMPDRENWIKIQIRILSYTDSYVKASKRALRAEETSNIETDDEDSRKKKKPRRYESLTSSEDDMPASQNPKPTRPPYSIFSGSSENSSLSTPNKNHCQLPKPPMSSGATGSYADTLSTPRRSNYNDASGTPVGQTPSRSVNKDVSGTPVGQEAFQRVVLLKMRKLEENQRAILQLLSQRGAESMTSSDVLINEILQKPVESVHEFGTLNIKLEESQDMTKQLTHYLASLGGNSLSKQTRNVMRFVARNHVWSNYSLKGRKEKLALDKLPIWRPILNALLRGKGSPSQSDVESSVADFLKYAPHQQGGLLHKKPNQTVPGTQEL